MNQAAARRDDGEPDREPDVAIIGGGPSGLACALELKALGKLRVAVFDRRTPPIDKPCGEGLMPDGVEQLRRLGVGLDAVHGMPFRGIRWLDDDAEPPIEVAGRFPGAPGLGIRRPQLHQALVTAAESAGVELHWGWTSLGPAQGTGTGRYAVRLSRVDRGSPPTEIRPRFLVAADGLRSPLRRALGLDGRCDGRLRFGVRRHYAVAPWSDCVEVHWGDGCEAYVTPIGDDEIGVALLWGGRKAGFDPLLAGLPRLRERLAGREARSRDLGVGPLRQRVSGVVRGNAALVGDAAGYVDALTGEGLSVALHQAHALARAVVDDDLAGYSRRCRSLDRSARWLTECVLALQGRPALRRRAFRVLARDPDTFERFLAVHVRALPAASLLPLAPGLLWRLLIRASPRASPSPTSSPES